MTRARTHVTVRMYNVGFGDAFLVALTRGRTAWRMLVDCGVHSAGIVHPIEVIVQQIIADLQDAAGGGHPHLNLVVATHHHADHIVGFADDAWAQVDVDEVWVPFVENAKDPDAVKIKSKQTESANRLAALLEEASKRSGVELSGPLQMAKLFAANSSGNAVATARLLGVGGKTFAGKHAVRFLPDVDPLANQVPVPGVTGSVLHVLGPSREAADLKRMDPPKSQEWLTFGAVSAAGTLPDDVHPALFAKAYVAAEGAIDQLSLEARDSLRLNKLTDAEELVAAASILENAVNNTSVFLVLDVEGRRLVFPGDSQQGAWDHVLNIPESRELVTKPAFYKVGHHGSHNATPKPYVNDVLGDGALAMLPWGLVKVWKKTIPKTELITALGAHKTVLVRIDDQVEDPRVTFDPNGLWSEVAF